MQGKVKFYSSDKGFGFIHSPERGDVYFHITGVNGAEPPKVGNVVRFEIGRNPKTGKEVACNVEILQRANDMSLECHKVSKFGAIADPLLGRNGHRSPKIRTLNGFPCVRGDHINGFRVHHSLGSVTVGKGFFSSSRDSTNEAREALIAQAKGMGANAVINYVGHNDRERVKGFFGGWDYIDNFWAEGEAVVLVSE